MLLSKGDFNVNVGRKEGLRGAVGRYSLHRANYNNGIRLAKLVLEYVVEKWEGKGGSFRALKS